MPMVILNLDNVWCSAREALSSSQSSSFIDNSSSIHEGFIFCSCFRRNWNEKLSIFMENNDYILATRSFQFPHAFLYEANANNTYVSTARISNDITQQPEKKVSFQYLLSDCILLNHILYFEQKTIVAIPNNHLKNVLMRNCSPKLSKETAMKIELPSLDIREVLSIPSDCKITMTMTNINEYVIHTYKTCHIHCALWVRYFNSSSPFIEMNILQNPLPLRIVHTYYFKLYT